MRDFLDLPIQVQNRCLFMISVSSFLMAKFLKKIQKNEAIDITTNFKNSDDLLSSFHAYQRRQELHAQYVPAHTVLVSITLLSTAFLFINRIRDRREDAQHRERMVPDYFRMGLVWSSLCNVVAFVGGLKYEDYGAAQIKEDCLQFKCSREVRDNKLHELNLSCLQMSIALSWAGMCGMMTMHYLDKNPDQAPRWLASTARFLRIEKPVRQQLRN